MFPFGGVADENDLDGLVDVDDVDVADELDATEVLRST